MNSGANRRLRWVIDSLPVWILFLLGIWLVVIRPLGPHFALVPGDLGDSRFNNYVLEHFYQWLTGTVKDYWNAPFFYPFPWTIAFSDNLLGSAPLYGILRWLGLDMVSAFQGWYILGYLFDFAAAGFVLWRLKLKPLAVGAGAFFFAFGLPLLAQENHVQLLYHFCIPLAGYCLWRFYQLAKLRYLAYLAALIVLQFYLTLYMGIFQLLFLGVMLILLPLVVKAESFKQRLAIWPRRLVEAWSAARIAERVVVLISIALLILSLLALLRTYFTVTRVYGFSRNIVEIVTMLPRFQSYFLADSSQIWGRISALIPGISKRWEHQLFPGLAVIVLVIVGLVRRYKNENSRIAWLHLAAALVLGVLTFQIHGISLYYLIWLVPGMDSVRAITRIMLVLMWPLSLFIAWSLDGALRESSLHGRWRLPTLYLIVGLLVAESVFYNHDTFNKLDAQARLDTLRQQIPATLPANPILFVARNQEEAFWAAELDSMLLTQELGWPTYNGYSGNTPPGYAAADSCRELPERIIGYMNFAGITDLSFYQGMMQRAVPIGFTDCNPAWWENMP